jgi:hypothetical protein
MSAEGRPLRRGIWRLALMGASAALCAALWTYWSALCGQTCPASRLWSLMVISVALPVVTVGIIFETAEPMRSMRLLRAYTLLWVLLFTAAVFFTVERLG